MANCRLTADAYGSLLWLSRQTRPMWGGLYQDGLSTDAEIARWMSDGIVAAVRHPHRVGRLEFDGGFVITPEGRGLLDALSTEEGGEG
jgi:hypothetical protein